MALLTTILTRIKKFILLLFSILRKGFCCRKKCRRNSGMILPMSISVEKKDDNIMSNKDNSYRTGPAFQQFSNQFNNEWNQHNSHLMNKSMPYYESNDVHNNHHINDPNLSNSGVINSNRSDIKNSDQESEPDFFRDMTPEIRKPKKIILATNQSNYAQNKSNRFSVDMKATITQSKELGQIDERIDDGSNSWEDNEELFDTDQSLKDLRQAEREKRIAEHQRIKLEKELRKNKSSKTNFTATKIS